MASVDWKKTAELIGIGAIVASLIFVGLQLKQSQDIAIAQQYQDRADTILNLNAAMMQSSVLSEFGARELIFARVQSWPDETIEWMEVQKPEYLATRFLMMGSLIAIWDNNYFQYQAGFLDEASWQAFRVRMSYMLSDPYNRSVIQSMRGALREPFQDVIDEILRELDESAENARRQ